MKKMRKIKDNKVESTGDGLFYVFVFIVALAVFFGYHVIMGVFICQG